MYQAKKDKPNGTTEFHVAFNLKHGEKKQSFAPIGPLALVILKSTSILFLEQIYGGRYPPSATHCLVMLNKHKGVQAPRLSIRGVI